MNRTNCCREQLKRRYPFESFQQEIAILDRAGGLIRSELAVSSAVTMATRSGACLHTGEPVTGRGRWWGCRSRPVRGRRTAIAPLSQSGRGRSCSSRGHGVAECPQTRAGLVRPQGRPCPVHPRFSRHRAMPSVPAPRVDRFSSECGYFVGNGHDAGQRDRWKPFSRTVPSAPFVGLGGDGFVQALDVVTRQDRNGALCASVWTDYLTRRSCWCDVVGRCRRGADR